MLRLVIDLFGPLAASVPSISWRTKLWSVEMGINIIFNFMYYIE